MTLSARVESQSEPAGLRTAFDLVAFAYVLNALEVPRREYALVGNEECWPHQSLHAQVAHTVCRVRSRIKKNR